MRLGRIDRSIAGMKPAMTPIDPAAAGAAPWMTWLDLQAQLCEQWFEWQRLMAQPLLDWQATVWMPCCEPWLALGAGPFVRRGAEQLA